MNRHNMTPENTEIVILSFEGPDPYAMAGGLGMRVDHLSRTLAEMGFPTHLFFIGDPTLPGEEARQGGQLILHRWGQWISHYYPGGVYEGENEKLYDFNESIPWFVKDHVVRPAVAQGKLVVVLGEEWHTTEAMCRLSDALHDDGLRDQVVLFWNANNTYAFHRINWPRLRFITTITTVSRYMKHLMWPMGLNPLAIPNGIPRQLLGQIDDAAIGAVRESLGAEVVLVKMARWDPDKNWDGALKATRGLKERGLKTVLVARGGVEPYGREVVRDAHTLGLRVKETWFQAWPRCDYLAALRHAAPADVLVVRSPIPLELSRLLYRAADAVLANSRHEPFGLVGLEAMAAGGVAVTGSTGEDYTIPLVNAIVLETTDPQEVEGYVLYLRDHPDE
jgi:glycosyltransferase involved in cell wall biosynthesis